MTAILTNWMFWILLIAIIFILALIGYLTENRKKNEEKKVDSNVLSESQKEQVSVDSAVDNNNVVTPLNSNATLNLDNGTWSNQKPLETSSVQPDLNSDWSEMPQVNNTIEPVSVQKLNEENLASANQKVQDPLVSQPAIPNTDSVNVDPASVTVDQTNTLPKQASGEVSTPILPVAESVSAAPTTEQLVVGPKNVTEKPLAQSGVQPTTAPIVQEISSDIPVQDLQGQTSETNDANIWK